MKHEPPKCPLCNKPLYTVWENEHTYLTYKFDEDKGTYIETSDWECGELEIICPYCGGNITDLVEEFDCGVCNYSSK